jgi:hypothetical protein
LYAHTCRAARECIVYNRRMLLDAYVGRTGRARYMVREKGGERRVAAGELRLLLPGRHTAKFEAICGCAPNPDTNPIEVVGVRVRVTGFGGEEEEEGKGEG